MNFREFLYEFHFSRKDMPQISDFEAFSDFMKMRGIVGKVVTLDPKKLEPMQNEFDQAKVDKIKKSNRGKPIIISKDLKVIDGHHRYYAHLQMNKTLECRQYNINADQFIKLLLPQPFVVRKGL